MKILTVVHGFPPESLAGTELVALNLAKSLRERGHDVLVFHRGESNERAEFDTEEATFEGLPTIRVINNLPRPTVALSYRNQAAERAFVAVAQRFQPDVVHVQHALHLSASLLPACAAHGWPTVLTLHDYWFICPTVQLLRPGGKLCQGPGSGFACFECVGRNEPGAALLARVGPRLAPAAHAVLRTGASIARRWTHYEMLDEAVALVERPAYMRSALEAADMIVAPSHSWCACWQPMALIRLESVSVPMPWLAHPTTRHRRPRRAGCAWHSSARCCPTKSRCCTGRTQAPDLPAPTQWTRP